VVTCQGIAIGQPIPLHIRGGKATPPTSLLSYTTEQADQLERLPVLQGNTAPAHPPAGRMTPTETIQGLTREDLRWLADFLDTNKQYEDEEDSIQFFEAMIARIGVTFEAMGQ
jgi:hypothetical protein